MAAVSLRTRRILAIAAAVAAGLLLLFLLLLSFGWGLLRPLVERRLSDRLARPVRIAEVARVGGGLLHPVLAIRGVSVAEPAWAGGGTMLRLDEARIRLAALPLLAGRVEAKPLLVAGLRARLLRAADGRANWEGADKGKDDAGGGPPPDLSELVIRDAGVDLDDRKRSRRFALRFVSDASGFHARGPGAVNGAAATVSVDAAPVGAAGPWPFHAAVRSAAVSLLATGQMAHAFDFGAFSADVRTEGRGLQELDRLIEVGLPATQPFRLAMAVRHDRPAWTLSDLHGTIGRSSLRADARVVHGDGRTRLDGRVVAAALDFDDLASDAELARGRAEARRTGPRVLPSTRIDLAKLRQLDGRVTVDVRRLLSTSPSIFRTLSGTAALDHGVLTVDPVSAGLTAGTLAGKLVVHHQTGTPLLTADLRLRGSRFERLFDTHGVLAGPVDGRVLMTGHGETVRDAFAAGDGRIALAGQGSMTRRVALFLGADVGRGLFAGNSDRTAVRCLVANFPVAHGIARPRPLVIDTAVARADGQGSVRLQDEAVLLRLYGQPKQGGTLRLNGPITVSGTLSRPKADPPPQTKTVGGILKMVGKALGGGPKQPLAHDADCGALTRQALR